MKSLFGSTGFGGWEVFPAIWNVADASISIGVIMVFIRQKKYFPKPVVAAAPAESEESVEEISDNENIVS